MLAEPHAVHVEWSGMGIVRVEDGKIAKFWAAPDMMSLMQQLGALPS